MTTHLRLTLLTAALLAGATGLLAGGAGNVPGLGGFPDLPAIGEEAAAPVSLLTPGMVTLYTLNAESPALIAVAFNGVNLQFAQNAAAQQVTWTWTYPMDVAPGNAAVVLTFADGNTATWHYQVAGLENTN